MLEEALFITIVGMLFVYAFLFLLMWSVALMSRCVHSFVKQEDKMDKIAAVIGIALRGEKK